MKLNAAQLLKAIRRFGFVGKPTRHDFPLFYPLCLTESSKNRTRIMIRFGSHVWKGKVSSGMRNVQI